MLCGFVLIVAKVDKCICILGQATQAAGIATDPDRSGRILGHHPDIVAGEAGRDFRVVAEVHKMLALNVEHVQAGILAATPQAIVAIDEQRTDHVAIERAGIFRIVPIYAEAAAVVTREAIVGADPDVAVAILHGLVDAARRQPGSDTQGVEIWSCIQWHTIHRRRRSQNRGENGFDPHASVPPF